jgi:4a-hydroxytetrahydrobiopterin dehydratase
MSALASKTCSPQHGPALAKDAAVAFLKQLSGWSLVDDGKGIRREFSFKNYYPTMSFVNAVAWIANQQDHHPDMTVGYNKVGVLFSTHSVGGLSENDFICAAKIDALGAL